MVLPDADGLGVQARGGLAMTSGPPLAQQILQECHKYVEVFQTALR